MIYNLLTSVIKIFYKIFFFAKVEGLENIPKSGGMIFCGNHKHFHDPLIIAGFVKNKLKFLAKSELFKNKIFASLLKSSGCIPVDRGSGDIKAMKSCINILKDQNPLVLFPEGTRSCKKLSDVKSGAILFAIKSQVPIIPVGLSNLKLFSGAKITFGQPIYYTDYYDKKMSSDDYKKLTNELMYEIFSMVEEKCCYYDELKASVENEH